MLYLYYNTDAAASKISQETAGGNGDKEVVMVITVRKHERKKNRRKNFPFLRSLPFVGQKN